MGQSFDLDLEIITVMKQHSGENITLLKSIQHAVYALVAFIGYMTWHIRYYLAMVVKSNDTKKPTLRK